MTDAPLEVKLFLPLDAPTVTGRYYPTTAVLEAFKRFKERVSEGDALCEFGFPNLTGMGPIDSVFRTREKRLSRVCARITDVEITHEGIVGQIEPFGPLKDMLNVVPVEVAFRGLTKLCDKDPNVIERVSFMSFDVVAPAVPPLSDFEDGETSA